MVLVSQGRFDGTGAEDPKDLALDGFVDAQAAKRQAGVGPVIEGRPLAGIPGDVPVRPRVRDVQAAATPPTPEQPREQTGSPSHRPAHHQPFHLRIVTHEREIPLVGVPGNIGLYPIVSGV